MTTKRIGKSAFDAGTFDGTEKIYPLNAKASRMTFLPCELPTKRIRKSAAALIHVLGEIGALELLEE